MTRLFKLALYNFCAEHVHKPAGQKNVIGTVKLFIVRIRCPVISRRAVRQPCTLAEAACAYKKNDELICNVFAAFVAAYSWSVVKIRTIAGGCCAEAARNCLADSA